MSDLLTHIARSEMVDIDLNLEPQCESVWHSVFTNIHNGPAAYWQVGPCTHSTGLRCASIVHSYRDLDPCSVCGAYAPLSGYRFIEL